MTENEWLSCTSPLQMLHSVAGRASARKLRLFACACCRRLGAGEAVAVCERYADGLASDLDLSAVRSAARVAQGTWGAVVHYQKICIRLHSRTARLVWHAARTDAWNAAWEAAVESERQLRQVQCDFLRELFGNPLQPVRLAEAWLAWENGTVRRLAQGIYDEGACERLPILADALEDAGCADATLLEHLRGSGPHLRGCWALDAILDKS
jgi:hypothetical protein